VHNLFDNLYVHGMNVHVGLLLGVTFAVGQRAADARHRQLARPAIS